MSKKIIQTDIDQVLEDIAENISNLDPILLLMVTNKKRSYSQIRFAIRNEKVLIQALIQLANTGYMFDETIDFIAKCRSILDKAENHIRSKSKLN